MTQRFRSPDRRPHRPRAAAAVQLRWPRLRRLCTATRWPRRCWRTACTWSARSFKYHRPRGIMSAGSEEPNALVSRSRRRARTPNLRATQIELYEGLLAASQNRLPSLAFDLGAVSNASRAAAAGRVLLQDLHVAARSGGRLYEPAIRAPPVSAARPPRPIPIATAPLRPLRRAGGRRRPGRHRRRARRGAPARASCCATNRRNSAGPADRDRRADRGRTAADWLRRDAGRHLDDARTSRCCRAPPRSAGFPTTPRLWPSG